MIRLGTVKMGDVSDVGWKPEHCTAFMYIYKFVSVCSPVCTLLFVFVCVCVYHRLSYSLLRLKEVLEQVVVEIKPNNKHRSIYKGYEPVRGNQEVHCPKMCAWACMCVCVRVRHASPASVNSPLIHDFRCICFSRVQ